MSAPDLQQRLAAIRLLAFDVDGVLTDGGIYLGEGIELKRFDVQDGAGIALARRAGYHVAFITGRESQAVVRRAEELRVTHVYQGVKNKVAAIGELCARLLLTPNQALFMGDDLPDIPIFKAVGLAVAPANASADAKAHAHLVTQASGGAGAVRELCELILKTQGTWDAAVADYLGERGRKEQ